MPVDFLHTRVIISECFFEVIQNFNYFLYWTFDIISGISNLYFSELIDLKNKNQHKFLKKLQPF